MPSSLIPLLEEAAKSPSAFMQLFPMIMVGAIVYFMMIRPMMKEKRQQEEQRKQLKRGQRVATGSGIIAKVKTVKETEVVLDLDGQASMTVAKSAIVQILGEKKDKKGSKTSSRENEKEEAAAS